MEPVFLRETFVRSSLEPPLRHRSISDSPFLKPCTGVLRGSEGDACLLCAIHTCRITDAGLRRSSSCGHSHVYITLRFRWLVWRVHISDLAFSCFYQVCHVPASSTNLNIRMRWERERQINRSRFTSRWFSVQTGQGLPSTFLIAVFTFSLDVHVS